MAAKNSFTRFKLGLIEMKFLEATEVLSSSERPFSSE